MEIFLNAFVFVIGLVLLVLSSDWLIQSSVKLAVLLRLGPLFIGLVLIAFGTSAPEAGVGIMAAIKNQKGIALGNIIGSNIANIGLVLGLCSIFSPLKVNKSILKKELPIMIGATLLFYFLSLDLLISRLDGMIFIVSFIIFCFVTYKGAKNNFDTKETDSFEFRKIFQKTNSYIVILVLTLVSLAGVALGADFMVRGGSNLAKIFKVSPWIIGITVFAIGTSLPELVTSITASIKKVPSISVGNIVGSNIFNILFVLGIVSLIRPIDLTFSSLNFEFPVLIIFSFLLFTVMKTRDTIARWEGVIMFLMYIGFLSFLCMSK